jgi:hypothetical protein
MATDSCCHATTRTATENPCAGHSRRGRIIVATKWIIPTAVLALLPKRPMCVAAYIALATGFSVSLPVATWIRTGLLVACLCTMAYLSIRLTIRAFNGRRPFLGPIQSRAECPARREPRPPNVV